MKRQFVETTLTIAASTSQDIFPSIISYLKLFLDEKYRKFGGRGLHLAQEIEDVPGCEVTPIDSKKICLTARFLPDHLNDAPSCMACLKQIFRTKDLLRQMENQILDVIEGKLIITP